ncbi:MAG: transketolase family protein [Oscillospiraceae bacterium]|nr:transketolase family protein [Oscillospiraceae bacterium]
MQMREVYAEALGELMERDARVVLLDADLGKASGTLGLRKRFPDRIFDCGVAEQNMASIAAGLASYGFKPWIESFTPFASRRICDQIAISICYAGMNVKIMGSDPGITAELNGGTHMSMEDIGVLRSIPGIVIFEPVDAVQLRAAMPVLDAYEGPVYLRLARGEQPAIFPEDYQFDLFRADVLREGSDLSIFVSGIQTRDCLDAAEDLADCGISCEVVNVHTIKPIDRETVIASARKTGAVLTVENHNVIGGLRSAVLEALALERIPVRAVGVEDRFGEVGKLPYLREAMGLTKEHVIEAAKEAVRTK